MARDEAYREAEERIEEARRSGATALDLSEVGLTEVPEALGQMTQLRELNLSRNQLTGIQGWRWQTMRCTAGRGTPGLRPIQPGTHVRFINKGI